MAIGMFFVIAVLRRNRELQVQPFFAQLKYTVSLTSKLILTRRNGLSGRNDPSLSMKFVFLKEKRHRNKIAI